ncbi:hypothetical protein KC365_g119 [Hortaea werneckii]|nr:hypothetical protein KC365_g119 [Hortaea werneckii]
MKRESLVLGSISNTQVHTVCASHIPSFFPSLTHYPCDYFPDSVAKNPVPCLRRLCRFNDPPTTLTRI